MKTVNAATLKEWLAKGEAVLVDVREPAEHASESIPGSKLVPLSAFSKNKIGSCSGKKLVIHCQGGGRGVTACERLLAEDKNIEVYNLEGGLRAWQQSGGEVKQSSRKVLPLDRQVQLLAGSLILTGSLLGYFVSPKFFLMSGFFGLGFVIAGLTGFCGGAILLAKAPWNQAASLPAGTACSWKPKA